MNSQPFFPGFPSRLSFTPLPNLFFARLLPEIDSLTELKLILHIFWRLYQKRGAPKFITYKELLGDKALVAGIKADSDLAESLRSSLDAAVRRGVLLHLVLRGEAGPEEVYFINNEANRKAIDRVQAGELTLGDLPQPQPYMREERPNIFTLYEQNIGLLTPMIAEELQEAETLYPPQWIEEAFREAVSLNKRSWSYIAAILRRWEAEGPDYEKTGRDTEGDEGRRRSLAGRYRHLVRR